VSKGRNNRAADDAALLHDATSAALVRLADIIRNGPHREAIDAAKLVLARTMPEPKASPTVPAIAGAAAGAIAATLAKAAERQQTRELVGQTVTDATFTPLGRVQNSEE
jgi:hypothetical protein